MMVLPAGSCLPGFGQATTCFRAEIVGAATTSKRASLTAFGGVVVHEQGHLDFGRVGSE
jgi:hypothetical protein